MKKIFLFITISALTLTGCSSDGGSSTSRITMKVDGVSRTFGDIELIEEPMSLDGVEYTYVNVIAENTNNPDQYIVFDFYRSELDTDELTEFRFYDGASESYATFSGDTFTSLIDINTSERAKGTFSGTLQGDQVLTITNGSFDIRFE